MIREATMALCSGVSRNLKGGQDTFQVYIFKSVQILALIFFTLNISTIFSPPRGVARRTSPTYAPGAVFLNFLCPFRRYISVYT